MTIVGLEKKALVHLGPWSLLADWRFRTDQPQTFEQSRGANLDIALSRFTDAAVWDVSMTIAEGHSSIPVSITSRTATVASEKSSPPREAFLDAVGSDRVVTYAADGEELAL